jgi:hypothetical protein
VSANSDFCSSDVRFGDGGGACIGGDQGHEKVDPNHLDNVRCHLDRSNLETGRLGRVPCGIAKEEQYVGRERGIIENRMLRARRLANTHRDKYRHLLR